MKKSLSLIKKYGVFALIFSLFISCKKELDKVPLSNFSDEDFWTSQNNAQLALNALYRANIQMTKSAEFSPSDWWSYSGLTFLEFATDNAYDRRGDNSDFNRMTSGALASTNATLVSYWSNSYAKIARVNYFLENVDKAGVDSVILKRWKAEAHFLRATQYFYLSQYWGSVPLVTKTLTLNEANNVAKNTKADVVKFTISELTGAVANLPRFKDLTAAERGRATKQAALAFLGRLQLAEGLFNDAAASFKQIIDFGDNQIDPNFSSLFDGTNEGSTELILATQFQADLAPNSMLQHFYPRALGGFSIFCPLQSLVDSYEFTDGTLFSYTDKRYNPKNIAQNRDPRLAFTVMYPGQKFRNITYDTNPDDASLLDQTTTSKQATRTGYCLRKYCPDNFSGGDLQNSGIDLPVIRYSEILLSYLEAQLESGQTVDQLLLDNTINKVRSRSSVNMPRILFTNTTDLRNILRRERRNELAFEGLRLWDLHRWKVIADVLKGDFYGAPFPGAKNVRKKGTQTDPYSRWYVTSKAYRAGTDDYWPIPQKEQDINPKLR